MTVLLLLIPALFAIGQCRMVKPCNGSVTIENVVQNQNVLIANVSMPYQFAIDYDTNTLFFSYTANKEEMFESNYLNLKDYTNGVIKGVSGGFAHAVDTGKQIVYIGGSNGIYTFDYNTKKATNIHITSDSIWQLFYKDGLYFTTHPDEKVYIYKDGQVTLVPELAHTKAMLVAVDNRKNMFYYRSSELHMLQNGTNFKLGDYVINAFNADIHGNIYFSSPSAIYRIKENNEIVKMITLPNVFGFAVKSDNTLIYGTENNIIELVPTKEMCYKENVF
ncbi:hypothetical protein ACJJTC_009035 [Scirpophaga incertulas]